MDLKNKTAYKIKRPLQGTPTVKTMKRRGRGGKPKRPEQQDKPTHVTRREFSP
jgi:hypothetical protein